MHPFARGNKANKLGPKMPYFTSDAYNQKTFRKEVAIEVAAYGGRPSGERPVKRRFERRAIQVVDSSWWLMKLPRPTRSLLRRWRIDEMRSIDEKMLRNAI